MNIDFAFFQASKANECEDNNDYSNAGILNKVNHVVVSLYVTYKLSCCVLPL